MTNIAAYIEQVARHYWGEPNPRLSKGTELRWGNHGSKSIDVRKGVWTDFETGESGGVVALVKANEPASSTATSLTCLRKSLASASSSKKRCLSCRASHVLTIIITADGVLAYQVLRFDNPKTFRQRRPNDRGGWINSIKDIEALPYNLTAIILTQQRRYLLLRARNAPML
jgi:hypothetical protein